MADDFPKPVNTSKQDPELLSGPHPFLHWLVPKRVLCGPFPDSTLVDILLEKGFFLFFHLSRKKSYFRKRVIFIINFLIY